MFRSGVRSAATFSRSAPSFATQQGRRFLSTAPPHKKSRSWKSSFARWGAAGGLVYWYNTAAVFAEEPPHVAHSPPEASREHETYDTLDSIAARRKADAQSSSTAQHGTAIAATPSVAAPGSPDSLEEEASQEGAFNEETGEINWDCPCLGGMATGPCGEQFKAAFSCFVYSKEEPKGVECIDHFKTMQNCFREHPDVYGSELDEDEVAAAQALDDEAPAGNYPQAPPSQSPEKVTDAHSTSPNIPSPQPRDASQQAASTDRAQAASAQVKRDHQSMDESDSMVPKAWHDSTESSTAK